MKILALAVACFILAGCYDSNLRTQERLDDKVDSFAKANGREPNATELATLKAEAEKDERNARRGELVDAGKDAVAGVTSAATGNIIAGGILLLGAVGTFLGLNRGKKAKPVPPSGGAV